MIFRLPHKMPEVEILAKEPHRVIAAANKSIPLDIVVVGVRHGCPYMIRQMYEMARGHMFPERYLRKYWRGDRVEQGFIDNNYQFLTRAQAMVVAEKAGQVIDGWMIECGELHSENLY